MCNKETIYSQHLLCLRGGFSVTIQVILIVSLKCVCFLVLTRSVVFYRSRMREEISDFLLDECD